MELCDANLEEYTLGRSLPGLPSWKDAVATRATLPLIVDIMRQIFDGLTHVHRNLNPQNSIPFRLPRLISSSVFLGFRMLEDRGFRSHIKSN